TVTGIIEDPSIDTDSAVELAARVSRDLEEMADRLGLERVRSSSDQHLFVAGIGRPSTEADSAAEFALVVAPLLDRFSQDTGVDAGFRIGMSSGDVISGLLASEQLTYGVFGQPPQTAVALGAIAGPGQILMHESIVGELDSKWQLEPTNNLLDLRGEDIQASRLIGSRQNGPDVVEGTPEPKLSGSG
ncbi:MAG: adenylate/guanylate cyclase domain-containing protein, partial [Actinomycetota bacterium]|nr:adenylate/guanylate cyclase domain-containing protein [Actinomycetota bacterium]